MARTYTAMANAMARQFGVMLDGSATASDSQEAASAALLGGTGTPGAAAPAGMPVPAGLSGLPGGPGVSAPPARFPKPPATLPG